MGQKQVTGELSLVLLVDGTVEGSLTVKEEESQSALKKRRIKIRDLPNMKKERKQRDLSYEKREKEKGRPGEGIGSK